MCVCVCGLYYSKPGAVVSIAVECSATSIDAACQQAAITSLPTVVTARGQRARKEIQ